ncbi:trichohyalin-like [Magallana gigas]|uniref:trichohyalin-like n=1 Tax=Magallana gigas TaxID=29159 RepID=UPI00333E2FBA
MIMIGSICSAIYKVSNNEYYFFDSHCHDIDGMSSFEGKSLLVFNRNIDDLVSFLYNMYSSMHIDFAMQFEILPISIATLCHSFPEKDPFQKRFYRMDEKQPVTNLVDKEQDRKSYMRDYMMKKRQNEQFKQLERNKEMSRKLKRQNVKVREKEKECDRDARKLKRQSVKEKENERETIARKLKRQHVEVREKEKECDRVARKLKRQSVKVKEKENERETIARKLKRQHVEVREKEKECDRDARKLKRQSVKVKEKENERETIARKLKRQHVEVREKEKECDRDARKLKRQSVKVKEKENERETIARKLKRQHVEVREKEKECDRDARKLKRQSVKVKEKENERETIARKLKRQHGEVREKEKECDRDARKLKRQSIKVKEKENERETISRKLKRQHVEVREKEREKDKSAKKLRRQSYEINQKEREKNRISKRRYRERPLALEKERLKKQTQRSDNVFRQNERLCDREKRQEKRLNKEYCNRESEQNKQRMFGMHLQNCIQNFHKQIKHGPIFVCSCCHQTWFRESVLNVDNTKLDSASKKKYLTNTTSAESTEWICNTCYSSIRENKIPKLSVLNGMSWPSKPKELNLLPLEERLVSLRIPFMQIRELPRGGQYSVKGNIVIVPVDVQPTVNSLPRKMDEHITVPVKLKKRLCYQKCDYQENVRPTKVLMALHWLMNNSDFYRNANINVDESWFQEITSSANEIVQEFVETQGRKNQNTDDDSEKDTEYDDFCEVDGVGRDGNCDTLLEDASRDMNQIYTFAPGEGQRPLSLYQDQNAEYLSFPTIFCGKGRLTNDERAVHVSYADIAKWELRSIDRRAAQSVPSSKKFK